MFEMGTTRDELILTCACFAQLSGLSPSVWSKRIPPQRQGTWSITEVDQVETQEVLCPTCCPEAGRWLS